MLELFEPLFDSLQYAFNFLIVLSILVAVHEYGHYIVAKWCGVKIEVFSVGFGKEIAGFTDKTGTRWKFSLIPLGGYVKMFGDMDPNIKQELYEDKLQRHRAAVDRAEAAGKKMPPAPVAPVPISPEMEKVSFFHKPLRQRALIVFAGPLANLLLAAAIYAGMLYSFGRPVTPPVLAGVVPGGPAAEAGLRAGDRVLAVDGTAIESFEELNEAISINTGTPVVVQVDRDGTTLAITATPRVVMMNAETHRPVPVDSDGEPVGGASTYALGDLGVAALPAQVAAVQPGSPAEAAGLQQGDIIRQVDDGVIYSFRQVVDRIGAKAGEPVRLRVERDGEPYEVTIVPEAVALDRSGNVVEMDAETGRPVDPDAVVTQTIGRIGVVNDIKQERVDYSLPGAIVAGVVRTGVQCQRYLQGLWQIVSGARSHKEMGGPIRIAQMSNQQAEAGVANLILFMAALSIGLAIINLLPIPVLDGGHLFMYAFEAVRGRPMSHKAMEYAFQFGAFILLSLMVFVFVNDIRQLFA